MVRRIYSICLAGAGLVGLLSFNAYLGLKPYEGPSPARTPAEELATFQVEPGFKSAGCG